jgi:hypothetical protein
VHKCVGVKLKYPLSNFSNGEKKMKTQVPEKENPVGGSGAREGAFSPTPHDLAQIKQYLKEIEAEAGMKERLTSDLRSLGGKALKPQEFKEKLREKVEDAIKDAFFTPIFGVSAKDVTVEYIYDDAPVLLNVYLYTKSLLWEIAFHYDRAYIVINNQRIAEIIISYDADYITYTGEYETKIQYIRLSEVNKIEINVVGE